MKTKPVKSIRWPACIPTVSLAAIALFLAVGVIRADTIYVSNLGDNTIVKFTPDGTPTVFANSGLDHPVGIALDPAGNLCVVSQGDNRIVKFTPGGVGSVFASTGLSGPFGMAFDPAGDLYVANGSTASIERFTPGGIGSVFANTGLSSPWGLAFDASGNLYVANNANSTIQKFTPGGLGSVFASTNLSHPTGLAFDRHGNLYVSSAGNNTIVKFTPNGVGSVFANTGLSGPGSLAFDSAGNLYVVNYAGSIEKFTTNGVGYLFANTGLNLPLGIAIDTASTATNAVLFLNATNGYVSVPSSSDLQNRTQITVEAWACPKPALNRGVILAKSDGLWVNTQRSYEFWWGPEWLFPDRTVSFQLFLNESTWAFVDTLVPDTNWVHIAATYTSGTGLLQLYTNGVLAASTTHGTTNGTNTVPLAGQTIRQTTLPLAFGVPTWDNKWWSQGYIDEVRVWTRARSAAEIQGTMFCRLTGAEPNLAGYWNFDDGTATDVTGHGHNGTLVGDVQIGPTLGSDLVHAGVCGLPRAGAADPVLAYDFVVAANVTDGGYGYTNTPTVRIIGGGGSGAEAVAVVSNGVVVAVNILDAGYGYTSLPLIVIAPPFIPNPVLNIAPMSYLAFSNLTVGGVYQLQQSVAWYWSNQPVNFTATNALYAQMVPGVADAGDYRLALNPVPSQAFATATVNYGFVVHSTVTSGGSGYVTAPAVSIMGGGGSNAGATATLSGGVVTAVTITNAGFGYTNTPTVRIAPPPAAAVPPTVWPVMRVDSANLAPYHNYQIQCQPSLGGVWGNWDGGPFTTTGATNSQYLFVTNGLGIIRLKHAP